MQTAPTNDSEFTFRVDAPDVGGPEVYLTCRMSDLPEQFFNTLGKVATLTTGQSPLMIEIRRVS
jgi:hypothetical protein